MLRSSIIALCRHGWNTSALHQKIIIPAIRIAQIHQEDLGSQNQRRFEQEATKYLVHSLREFWNIRVRMIRPILSCFFLLPILLLLHLVSSHSLPVPSTDDIRAQGPGSGGSYVKVAKTLIKQVLKTYGTAFNCHHIFRTPGFYSCFNCFPLVKESR